MKSYKSNKSFRKLIIKSSENFSWRPNYRYWLNYRLNQELHQEFRLKPFFRNVTKGRKKMVLDLGCGMGGFLTALSRQGVADTLGIDFDYDSCQIAKLRTEKYRFRTPVLQAVGEHLPFKNNSLDAVVCFEVLEHAKDYFAILTEIKRVLKPKGEALITIPNRLSLYDPHYYLPFINWFPRRPIEWILKYLGRVKRKSLSRQKLSEMHYVYYWEIISQLKKLEFESRDILRDQMTNPKEVKTKWLRRLINLFSRLGLANFFYLLLACFYIDTFQFYLKKIKKGSLRLY